MDFLKPLYDEELNNEGDVEIVGSVFARSRILGELEHQTYTLTFSEWVDLCTDRTVASMIDLVEQYKPETLPRHYAFLELRADDDRVARKKELAAANIFPIWYPE